MQEDLRSDRRRHMLLPAKILFNDRQSVIDCTIKNLSSGGALLNVASRLGIPDHFTLDIPRLEERHPCRIVWSNMFEIGVSFAPCFQNPDGPELHIVR